MVTKLKINTVLCKDCFLLLQHTRLPYIFWDNMLSVPSNRALERNRFQMWYLKFLAGSNPLNLKEVQFTVAKCCFKLERIQSFCQKLFVWHGKRSSVLSWKFWHKHWSSQLIIAHVHAGQWEQLWQEPNEKLQHTSWKRLLACAFKAKIKKKVLFISSLHYLSVKKIHKLPCVTTSGMFAL